MENYVLIISTKPLKTEMSSVLYVPEKEKSENVIKIHSSTIPEINNVSLVLNDQYKIEIIDKSSNKTVIKLNQLCVSSIEYDYKSHIISYFIDEGLKILGHKIILKRTNPEIRNDIIFGLKKISEISIKTDISTINKIETCP